MPHTPGPWFVFDGRPCVGGPSSTFMDADPAQQTAGIAMCGMRLRTEDESMANARLISAAPELLAAITPAAIGFLRDNGFDVVARNIQAAIAKATGK